MAVEAQEGPRRGADLNKDEKVGRYLKDKKTPRWLMMLLLTSLSSRRSARASTSLSVNFGAAASAASRAGEQVSKQRTTATEREGLGFSDKSLDRYDEKRPVAPGSFVHRRLKELRAKKRLRMIRN